jgi:hypothetical protein
LLGNVLRALSAGQPQLSNQEKFRWQRIHAEKVLKTTATETRDSTAVVTVNTDPRYYYKDLEIDIETYLKDQNITVIPIPCVESPYESNRTSGAFSFHCDWSGTGTNGAAQ